MINGLNNRWSSIYLTTYKRDVDKIKKRIQKID